MLIQRGIHARRLEEAESTVSCNQHPSTTAELFCVLCHIRLSYFGNSRVLGIGKAAGDADAVIFAQATGSYLDDFLADVTSKSTHVRLECIHGEQDRCNERFHRGYRVGCCL